MPMVAGCHVIILWTAVNPTRLSGMVWHTSLSWFASNVATPNKRGGNNVCWMGKRTRNGWWGMSIAETPSMDDKLRRIAESAPADIRIGLSLYAWPKCERCGQYGRYFDPGYLAGFIVQHEDCQPKQLHTAGETE